MLDNRNSNPYETIKNLARYASANIVFRAVDGPRQLAVGNVDGLGWVLHARKDHAAAACGYQSHLYAKCIGDLGIYHWKSRNYEDAEALLIHSKDLRKIVVGEHDEDYAAALINLAGFYRFICRYGDAESVCEQAHSILRQMPESVLYASCLTNLANIFSCKSEYKRSLPILQEIVEIREKVFGKHHIEYAKALTNLALALQESGEYKKAEALHLEGTSIRASCFGERHPNYAASLTNLAGVYHVLGEYEKAEELLLQSASIEKSSLGSEHPQYLNTIMALGNIYVDTGAYEKAKNLAEEQVRLSEVIFGTTHREHAGALGNLARLHYELGEYDLAMEHQVSSKDLFLRLLGERNDNFLQALHGLSKLHSSMGEHCQAQRGFTDLVARVAEEFGDKHPLYAKSLHDQGNSYLATGSFVQAIETLRLCKATQSHNLGGYHPSLADTLLSLGFALLAMGKCNEALEEMLQAVDIHTCLLRTLVPALPEKRRLELIRKVDFGTASLLSLSVSAGISDPKMVHQCCNVVFERKGFAFDLPWEEPLEGPDGKLSIKQQEIQTELCELRRVLARQVLSISPKLEHEGGSDFQDVLGRIERLEKELGAVSVGKYNAWRTSYDYADQSLTSQMSSALPAGSALLEYVLYSHVEAHKASDGTTSPAYAVIVLESQSSEPCMFSLGLACEIDQDISQFCSCLSGLRAETSPTLRAIGERLQHRVLGKVLEALSESVRDLIIAPDGELAKVPFAALPIGSDQLLVDKDITISYVFSGRHLLNLCCKDQFPLQTLNSLVIADPDYDHTSSSSTSLNQSVSHHGDLRGLLDFEPLSGTAEEGRRVTDILSFALGHPAMFLSGHKASVAAMFHHARNPFILHVATHGFFLEDQSFGRLCMTSSDVATRLHSLLGGWQNPFLRSGLALAGARAWQQGTSPEGGAIVTALELRTLDWRGTRLAVLSACDTGRGDKPRGQGVLGLGRALVLAGAESVLLSLWHVQDNAGCEFMTTFYEALFQSPRTSRARALKLAQQRIRVSGARPALWASFILYGAHGPLMIE